MRITFALAAVCCTALVGAIPSNSDFGAVSSLSGLEKRVEDCTNCYPPGRTCTDPKGQCHNNANCVDCGKRCGKICLLHDVTCETACTEGQKGEKIERSTCYAGGGNSLQ